MNPAFPTSLLVPSSFQISGTAFLLGLHALSFKSPRIIHFMCSMDRERLFGVQAFARPSCCWNIRALASC